jgi:hypothetical protein
MIAYHSESRAGVTEALVDSRPARQLLPYRWVMDIGDTSGAPQRRPFEMPVDVTRHAPQGFSPDWEAMPGAMDSVWLQANLLGQWSSAVDPNANWWHEYSDYDDLPTWIARGRVLVVNYVQSGKTANFSWLVQELASQREPKLLHTRRHRPGLDAHRLSRASDPPAVSTAALARALDLFASLVALQDWLLERPAVRMPPLDQPSPCTDAPESLSSACGVRRLSVPLVPRAPGRAQPGFTGSRGYVLGA